MEIRTEYVNLSVSDGTSMRGYVARPVGASGASAGLLVFQEAFGVNGHIRDVTERFAREGYLAIAPELFHRTGAGFEGRYDDFPSVMTHMRAMTPDGLEADFRSAYDWLRANGKIGDAPVAAIGYCMGGRAAFRAAATLPLRCAVSFYGGGIAPNQFFPEGLLGRAKDVSGPLLLVWGGRDKHIGPDQVRAVTDALRAAGKDFINVEFSEADHGFFCDARPSHHAASAALAWPLTLAFLRAHTLARSQEAAAHS
jgi:carboxymethylenebutenolidase